MTINLKIIWLALAILTKSCYCSLLWHYNNVTEEYGNQQQKTDFTWNDAPSFCIIFGTAVTSWIILKYRSTAVVFIINFACVVL